MAASSIALKPPEIPLAHQMRGHVGMWCLIAAESSIFTIFVVAYLFYAGKSLTGPYPNEVLHVPVFNSICLFASSFTIVMAEHALRRKAVKVFGIWWLFTIVLGLTFLVGTAREWYGLIYHDGLTISTNLFGTTFYSLVGLHASHVIIGLTGQNRDTLAPITSRNRSAVSANRALRMPTNPTPSTAIDSSPFHS